MNLRPDQIERLNRIAGKPARKWSRRGDHPWFDADDLAQEAVLRALVKFPSLPVDLKLRLWNDDQFAFFYLHSHVRDAWFSWMHKGRARQRGHVSYESLLGGTSTDRSGDEFIAAISAKARDRAMQEDPSNLIAARDLVAKVRDTMPDDEHGVIFDAMLRDLGVDDVAGHVASIGKLQARPSRMSRWQKMRRDVRAAIAGNTMARLLLAMSEQEAQQHMPQMIRCAWCGTEFATWPGKGRRYCDNSCSGKAGQLKQMAQKMELPADVPAWRIGDHNFELRTVAA